MQTPNAIFSVAIQHTTYGGMFWSWSIKKRVRNANGIFSRDRCVDSGYAENGVTAVLEAGRSLSRLKLEARSE